MECLFRHVYHDEMILNDAGQMIEKWYWQLEDKFPGLYCDEMQVMPNHFHCILEITGMKRESPNTLSPKSEAPVVADPSVGLNVVPIDSKPQDLPSEKDKHMGLSLQGAMQWFKTMTTNEYINGVKNLGWPPFERKLWLRSYYDHVIRSQHSYDKIAHYIKNNPSKWKEDKFFQ